MNVLAFVGVPKAERFEGNSEGIGACFPPLRDRPGDNRLLQGAFLSLGAKFQRPTKFYSSEELGDTCFLDPPGTKSKFRSSFVSKCARCVISNYNVRVVQICNILLMVYDMFSFNLSVNMFLLPDH